MALTYTEAQIQAKLDSISSIADDVETNANDIDTLETTVGEHTTTLGTLSTTVEQTFTSVSNGKRLVASAITDKGITTTEDATFQTMATNISNISTGMKRFISNDTNITVSGSYASSTYYNTSWGVKVGYMPGGQSILLSIQGGTSTGYEYIYFYGASLASGLTLTQATTFVSSQYVTASPSNIYACVISGFDVNSTYTISVNFDYVNASYDYTRASITITKN